METESRPPLEAKDTDSLDVSSGSSGSAPEPPAPEKEAPFPQRPAPEAPAPEAPAPVAPAPQFTDVSLATPPLPAEPAPATQSATLADKLYARLRERLGPGPITATAVAMLISSAVSTVERFSGMTGLQKKELAVQAVRRIIAEIPGDHAEISLAADLLLPSMVDALVSASKGQLNINRCCVIV